MTPPTDQSSVLDDENRHDITEQTALLNGASNHDETPAKPSISRKVVVRLCISHFLSAWNSRLFEFGSVLFLTSIYPDTLMPVSIYALVRAASAIGFSPAIGRWIDRTHRLFVVRVSIVGERLAIAVSCGVFLLLEMRRLDRSWLSYTLFAVCVVLAGVEKLCAIMNNVSVKRDWMVEMIKDNEADRRVLNAQIRRIDLICKLLSPFLIASIDQASTVVAIWTTMAMNALSIFAEYWCIERVYDLVPSLHQPHNKAVSEDEEADDNQNADSDMSNHPSPTKPKSWIISVLRNIFPWSAIGLYARHPAFLPSFAYAFLHFTVLSFSGRMIAFLIASGFSSFNVGVARTISTISELSATWISPVMINRLGSIRSAGLSITWQTVWLSFGVACFLASGRSGMFALVTLIAGVVMSRIGLWGFDLAVQNIIQDEVESDNRGSFSTAEASVQNVFELLSYVSTIVFAKPEEFHWPMIMTMISAYAGCVTYATYTHNHRRQ